jgi:hypothetical protein
MSADALIENLPDLVLLIRRDGTLIAQKGGHAVADLKLAEHMMGQRLEALWPEAAATPVNQLVRKALSVRAATETKFTHDGTEYEARVTPQGPDRALCVIRSRAVAVQDTLELPGARPRPQLDRRGFLRRFKETMSVAALRERPIAVAVIHVDGIADIAQIIAPRVAEQLMSAAILRLPTQGEGAEPAWYLGNSATACWQSFWRPLTGCSSARVCESRWTSVRQPSI